MPMPRELRNDAYKLYLLIGERDMPSNCTMDRLRQRSAIPAARIVTALDLLWSEDTGFVRFDENRRTGERGYFVDPKSRKKTPADLDALWNARQAALAEAEEGPDEDDEDFDPDDEWKEPDEDEDG